MAEERIAVQFTGSISQGKNAISFGSNGIRVQFDIPEIYSIEANKLTALRSKILNVKISVEEDGKKVQHSLNNW